MIKILHIFSYFKFEILYRLRINFVKFTFIRLYYVRHAKKCSVFLERFGTRGQIVPHNKVLFSYFFLLYVYTHFSYFILITYLFLFSGKPSVSQTILLYLFCEKYN